jgi:CheY-like chemotaxis protein
MYELYGVSNADFSGAPPDSSRGGQHAGRGAGAGGTVGNHVTKFVDHVRDGAEALDYLLCRGAYANRDKDNPSVVLLDLKMPKLDGIEVLREMKANPRLKMIPVVMMTSSREEQDLTAATNSESMPTSSSRWDSTNSSRR